MPLVVKVQDLLMVRLARIVSRLTTLGQAAGNDEGLKVEVIDKQDKMGKGKGGDTEGE